MAKANSKAFVEPQGMQEINPFGESGDGWYQFPDQKDAASAPPIDATFLGTVMVKGNSDFSDEPQPVHKFKLVQSVPGCLGAKGTDHEGQKIDLEAGQVMLMWGKADINQKLADKEGAHVFLKSIGMKAIGKGRSLWEWLVKHDPKSLPSAEERATIRAQNARRGKKAQDVPSDVQGGSDDIPF